LPLGRLIQALNAIMEDHDQHVILLNEKGPQGGIYLDENTSLNDLCHKLILYNQQTNQMLNTTHEPLLYHNATFRYMLKTTSIFF